MVVLKSCCCFGLRTGAVIVGWFGLVGGIIWIATAFGLLAHIDEIVPKSSYNMNNIPHEQIDDTTIEVSKILITIGIVFLVINIMIDVSLLWGTNKVNHLMLLPWLIMNGIYYSIFTIGVFIIFIILLVIGQIPYAFLLLLLGCGIMALPIYIWLCIFSLYQRFKLDSKEYVQRMNEIGFRATAPIIGDTSPPYVSFQ